MENNISKIAVIGVGAVGSTSAYILALKNLASEIVLIDVDKKKQEGEVMDMNDVLPFVKTEKIIGGEFKDTADADIIIIAAGLAQKTNETRLDLASKNKVIMQSIFSNIGEIKKDAIIIVVSNPVDVLTYLAQEISGLSVNQVFGTGTSLDTARLRTDIGEKLGVNAQSVEGFILGEHGDSEFVAWSSVTVGGAPIHDKLSQSDMDAMELSIKNEAQEIISRKGATYYGIATVVADLVSAVLLDENKVVPISTRLDGWNGVSGVCLGIPAVLGRNGVKSIWNLELTYSEKEKLKFSAEKIKGYL